MDFRPNITPIEVIKKKLLAELIITNKWYKNSWKEFDVLKDIDQKYYCSNYYGASINKYGVKYKTSLTFGKIKDGLIQLILMVGFSGILDIG